MVTKNKKVKPVKDFDGASTLELLNQLRKNFQLIAKYFRDTTPVNSNDKTLRNRWMTAMVSADAIKNHIKKNQ